MTDRHANSLVFLPLLAALGLHAACASDKDPATGTGGAPGIGSSLGGGGTSGNQPSTVGSGTPRPCKPSETIVAPADGLIADFANADGNSVDSRILTYPIGSASAPSYTTASGALHITLDRPATSVPQYLGVVLQTGPSCMDATAFHGVQFSISGSFSGCSMQFYANDDAHQDDTTGAPHASGPAGSYPPQAPLTSQQVTSTAQILQMPFSDQVGGNPPTPIDRARLIMVAWQFTVDATTGTAPSSCVADLVIDDVRFY